MFQTVRQKYLFFSISALGLSSIITQILAIREFISVFYGNELVLGIILANWLFLTAVGAYVGKFFASVKDKLRLLIISQILIALLPVLLTIAIRLLRNIVFLPGLTLSITEVFVSSLVILLPYCIIGGYLLTLACMVYSDDQSEESIGKVYFIDNIGDIFGGFLFSFVLIYLLGTYENLFLIGIVNLIACFALSVHLKKYTLAGLTTLILIGLITVFSTCDINIDTLKSQYNQHVIYQKDSPYGNLVITQDEDQINFFENGVTLFTTLNTVSNEEAVHYAMVQHPVPKKVLLISGGVAGTIAEIQKYNVERIDYVELDPLIIDAGKTFTANLDYQNLNIITQDARLYVGQTNNKYDVIIVDTPDPNTAQINRFFTKEFFNNIHGILFRNGVFGISLSGSPNYMSEESKVLNSSIYRTIKESFEHIIIIPGERNYFVASDEKLSYNIKELIEHRRIRNDYVNKYYLDGIITADRIKTVDDGIKIGADVNTDFRPISYYYHLLYWTSQFNVDFTLLIVVLGIALITFLATTRPVPFALFTTGFFASGMEIVLLISFQILYGYVYSMLGIIITSFMLGLALGAFYMNKNIKAKSTKTFLKIEFGIVLFSVVLPLILYALKDAPSMLSNILFPVLTVFIAFFVGAQFPLASKLYFKKVEKTAASLYWADLFGASFGSLVVSAFLIPVLGIFTVCLVFAVLNLISGTIIWATSR